MQVMVVLTAMLVGIMSTLIQVKNDQVEQDFVLARARVLDIRENILGTIGNQYAWRKSAAHADNPSMACLLTGTCSPASSGTISLINSAGTKIVDGTSATSGFQLDGTSCNTFAETGGGLCVVRAVVSWRASCVGAPGSPNCEVPEENVEVRFTFNRDRLHLAPARYNVVPDPITGKPVMRGELNPDTAVLRCAARQKVYVGHAQPRVLDYTPDAGGCIPAMAFVGPPGPQGFQGPTGQVGAQGAQGPPGPDWDDPVPPGVPTPTPWPPRPVCYTGSTDPMCITAPPVQPPACKPGTGSVPPVACDPGGEYEGEAKCDNTGTGYTVCQPTPFCKPTAHMENGICVPGPPVPPKPPVKCVGAPPGVPGAITSADGKKTCNASWSVTEAEAGQSFTETATNGGWVTAGCVRTSETTAEWLWKSFCPDDTNNCWAAGIDNVAAEPQAPAGQPQLYCNFLMPSLSDGQSAPMTATAQAGATASGSVTCKKGRPEFNLVCKRNSATICQLMSVDVPIGGGRLCRFETGMGRVGESRTVTAQSGSGSNAVAGSVGITCLANGNWNVTTPATCAGACDVPADSPVTGDGGVCEFPAVLVGPGQSTVQTSSAVASRTNTRSGGTRTITCSATGVPTVTVTCP